MMTLSGQSPNASGYSTSAAVKARPDSSATPSASMASADIMYWAAFPVGAPSSIDVCRFVPQPLPDSGTCWLLVAATTPGRAAIAARSARAAA